ncbi:rhodanese-related sulfurtransferase [Microbacteriaceae bacterium SG_E_30_P1]|uniref:Rhodanese-related sulfurtransferase n=1 Tax=Antiquaquibacter oligotrophicus TaxID=2880260 RepID=A0ABT6KL39_9MICO|nr:rhodanese-like domain-containing protein [Antiquaquibacter oligotrophicus]MDH6179852.1 rhodanese-related sulfurtransferase [Antiquaquibacter oligotrophicus]UDF14387.1 rhodanese-like domain-containing protein [Antiquaquibacter oligotrophicus]
METIDVDALAAIDGATIIDVREPWEYEGGHIPTAVSIPMSAIVERVDEVPRDGTVYLVCESGYRSSQVGQWLDQQGVDVVNVEGGTAAWRASGRPVD